MGCLRVNSTTPQSTDDPGAAPYPDSWRRLAGQHERAADGFRLQTPPPVRRAHVSPMSPLRGSWAPARLRGPTIFLVGPAHGRPGHHAVPAGRPANEWPLTGRLQSTTPLPTGRQADKQSQRLWAGQPATATAPTRASHFATRTKTKRKEDRCCPVASHAGIQIRTNLTKINKPAQWPATL